MRRDLTMVGALITSAVLACAVAFALDDLGLAIAAMVASAIFGVVTVRLITSAQRHERAVRRFRLHSTSSLSEGTRVRTGNFNGTVFVGGLARPEIFADFQVLAGLTKEERRAVLLHEQHHLRRRDPARMWLELLVHPIAQLSRGGRAWLTVREADREIRADRYALDHGASVVALASALIKVQPAARLVSGFGSAIDLRVAALAGEPVPPRTAMSHWAMLAAAGAGAALCLSALHSVWAFCCP